MSEQVDLARLSGYALDKLRANRNYSERRILDTFMVHLGAF